MSKKINNSDPAPQGQAVGTDVNNDIDLRSDKVSVEDIEKKIEELNKVVEPKIEPKLEPTVELKVEPEVITEELPEELLKKTPEDLVKMYTNRRKLWDKQAQELGTLRKKIEEGERLNKEIESLNLNLAKEHLIKQTVKSMTQEEKDKIFEELSSDPEKAITNIVTKVMNPFLIIQARHNNEMALKDLDEKTKDDLVKYSDYKKEVDLVIAKYNTQDGRNALFDRYGSGTFEAAFNEVKDLKLPEALKKRDVELIEKATLKAEEEYKKKLSSYTESQGVAIKKSGKGIDYKNMPAEQAIEEIEGRFGFVDR